LLVRQIHGIALFDYSYKKFLSILSNCNELVIKQSNGDVKLTSLAKSLFQLSNSKHLRIAGKFYILPKNHKLPLTGRPIVSCINNTLTYHTSTFLHNLLKPFLQKLPSICSFSRDVVIKKHHVNFIFHKIILF
jgi:hypothetical protein